MSSNLILSGSYCCPNYREEKIMNTPFKRLSDHNAVVEIVQIYIEAGITGNAEQMKTAFYEDATMYGFVGPDFFGGPIQVLFDWASENPAGESLQARIASVEIIETIATVRVELENWAGQNFTDLLTLVKSGDAWKIISKAYHTHL